MKCIIDTDPGADDVLALIMALNSPELEILALTTVEGNARLEHTTANALRLLAYMGRSDIPVYEGESMPLEGEFHHAYEVHGTDGLTVRLPDTEVVPADGNAVDFIIETALAPPGEVTLFALGPLTNVARALIREERLKDALKRVYVMGGTGGSSGNVTPYAEFNIYDDPHASNVVFGSGAPVTLLGLNITRQTSIARDDENWFTGETPGERLAARILENWFELGQGERQRFSMHDPVTIMAALRPDLMQTQAATLTVETKGERVGEITADYANGGSVDVAVEVESEEALAFMRGLLCCCSAITSVLTAKRKCPHYGECDIDAARTGKTSGTQQLTRRVYDNRASSDTDGSEHTPHQAHASGLQRERSSRNSSR